MALDFFHTQRKRPGLIGVEKIMLIYMGLTTLIIAVMWDRIDEPVRLLAGRAFILVCMGLVITLYRMAPSRATLFLRVLYQCGLLAYWYPDTYEINRIFPNLDHYFAAAEDAIFGCQPALAFPQALHTRHSIWDIFRTTR